ncbi:MAG: PglZ domain-containing protein [Coriobacteriia bacterium]|nr:PglZ domain-containing protein [Coriobacteriia bacterium]
MSKKTDIQARIAALFAPTAADGEEEHGSEGHRVVIWHDPDGQFEADLASLELPEGVRLLIEEPNHLFELKCAINAFTDGHDTDGLSRSAPGDPAGILIYRRRPARTSSSELDWLADVERYAESFQADWTSLVLSELRASDTIERRAGLARHKRFLRKRLNIRAIIRAASSSSRDAARGTAGSAISRPIQDRDLSRVDNDDLLFQDPRELDLAVMALALSKENAPCAEDVIVTYITRAWREGAEGLKRMRADLEEAGSDADLAELLFRRLGFGDGESLPAEISRAVRHILLTAASLSLPADKLGPYAALISVRHREWCQWLLRAWDRTPGADRADLLEMCRDAEQACDLSAMFAHMDASRLARVAVFPAAQECSIRLLCDRARAATLDASVIEETREAARDGLWYRLFAPCWDSLARYSELLEAQRDIALALADHPDAEKLWTAYTGQGISSDGDVRGTTSGMGRETSFAVSAGTRLSAADTAYRHLHVTARRALLDLPSPAVGDAVKTLLDAAEGVYARGCLRPLCDMWSSAIERDVAAQGYVDSIPRQEHLFMNEVPSSDKTRTYVVVSDALRYEMALELVDRLERDLKGTCTLSAVQSVLPSATRCGTAALLPHGALEMTAPYEDAPMEEPAQAGTERFSIRVDGLPVQGARQCQAVLRRWDENAVAVRYADFAGMGTDARRALVIDARVVYLYHSVMAATDGKPDAETPVFEACDRSIDELVALVKMIVGIGGSRVVITSGHGFFHTAEPLPIDTANCADVEGVHIEDGQRFIVARKGAHSDRLLEVNLDRVGGADLVGFTPRDASLVMAPGEGDRFVHGGLSLQEMCVPVIRFVGRGKASVAARPAQLEAVNTRPVIGSSPFNIDLLQTEPVGGKVAAAAYDLFVADEAGTPITTVQVVFADRTSPEPPQRTMHVGLSLIPGAKTFPSDRYFLTLRDRESGVSRRVASFRINIFASKDSGW